MKLSICVACLFLLSPAAFAQMPCFQQAGGVMNLVTGQYNANFTFSISPSPVLGALPGRPYSAEELTQQTQTLADGTSATNSSSSNFTYRDFAGRTRTERSFPSSFALKGNQPNIPVIPQIFDPVAGFCICLDTVNKVAHRAALPQPIKTLTPPQGLVFYGMAPMIGMNQNINPKDILNSREDLGTKLIEGVSVKGSRQTTTYPIGAVGNDAPLTVISETWVSAELNAVVYSKTSDPRSGENIHALINISRDNPDPGFFQIPSDYKVVDETGAFSINYKGSSTAKQTQ
jgi:hypothetical protein